MVAFFEADHDGLNSKEMLHTIRDFLPGSHAARVDVGTGTLYTLVVSDTDTAMAGSELMSATSGRFDEFGQDVLGDVVGASLGQP